MSCTEALEKLLNDQYARRAAAELGEGAGARFQERLVETMKDIMIDTEGQLHCANCGAVAFTLKRTFRAKAIGGTAAVATFGLAAAALPLATAKKLKCQACGTYNKTGNAQPFAPPKQAPPTGQDLKAQWQDLKAQWQDTKDKWRNPRSWL